MQLALKLEKQNMKISIEIFGVWLITGKQSVMSVDSYM